MLRKIKTLSDGEDEDLEKPSVLSIQNTDGEDEELKESNLEKRTAVRWGVLFRHRRPFPAPTSLRNLVRIFKENIETQNTCC